MSTDRNSRDALFESLLNVSERSIEVSGQLKGKIEQSIREIQEINERALDTSKKLDIISREVHELWDWHNKDDPEDPARKVWYTPIKLKETLDKIHEAFNSLQSSVVMSKTHSVDSSKSKAALYTMWGTIGVAFLGLIGTIVALLF